ncbi:alpha/beta fold hydrolase [Vibrio gallicus]|uniref:alpha/beta fold hydrolase n=1 Tax=Vibrio gallicus TaxID=190897 RepID=UPI0021C26116|nr:alpha/beta fold hydrolase [Vibrio gallicus]
MHIVKFHPIIPCALLLLTACTSEPQDAQYRASEALQPYQQSNYQQYLQQTQDWVTTHRAYISQDHDKELNAVLPYELKPAHPNGKGILLVHGLGDSPYSYSDIAPTLAQQGYLVRVILLPGHGTRAADLSLPELNDWQNIVKHNYQLLSKRVDKVWLGGFSTGANLVTELAYQQDSIEGLLLFAPAFKPKDPLAKFSPYANWFVDWAGKEKEDNYTRYNSLHMNGAAVYYQTSVAVREYIESNIYTKPTFVMLSERDETIDAHYAANELSSQFTNPNNVMLWFGDNPPQDTRVSTYTMDLPKQKIVSASHISVMYSPNNPVYKRDGEIRLCFKQQPESAPKDCSEVDSSQVWYGAWGDGDEHTVRARTSWNPYFKQSMQKLKTFLETADNSK